MRNIPLAKKISFKEGDNVNETLITIEPLFPGYGMTLGNSLRRVLLSSLSGAAVVGVKVKGASHEFMALPHVKEDVLEIILNIKQLRVKMFDDEEVRLELSVKGKKVVTAKDIRAESRVEITTPDLVLAEITDAAGSLDLEIFISKGLGYKMTDSDNKESREIGYIEIDSIFSPVNSVSFETENTRVGKMTNWDKINLKVKTDGTISAKEAFEDSVKILADQYNAFLQLINPEEFPVALSEDKEQMAQEIEELVELEEELGETEEEEEIKEVKVKKEKKEKKEVKVKKEKKEKK